MTGDETSALRERVKGRAIERMRELAAAREGIVARLDDAYEAAMAGGDLNTARQCCMDRLRVAGLLADRVEVTIEQRAGE